MKRSTSFPAVSPARLTPTRKMRPEELALIQAMIKASRSPLNIDGLADCDVSDLEDGGMMSIAVHPCTEVAPDSLRIASEATCEDSDGVSVIVSLFVDRQGNVRELGIWKTDFSPLRDYPAAAKMSPATPPASP